MVWGQVLPGWYYSKFILDRTLQNCKVEAVFPIEEYSSIIQNSEKVLKLIILELSHRSMFESREDYFRFANLVKDLDVHRQWIASEVEVGKVF